MPHAPVNDYSAVFANEQVLSRGMKVKVTDPNGKPVDLIGSPFHMTGAELPFPSFPPRLGEDTDAVLQEILGLDQSRLAELRARELSHDPRETTMPRLHGDWNWPIFFAPSRLRPCTSRRQEPRGRRAP